MTHSITANGGTAFQLPVMQIDISEAIGDMIAEIVAFLPRLIAAIVILLIGWIIGIAVAKLITALADKVQLDRAVLDTPLGRMMGGTERAVSHTFGLIGKWFVYALAILAAANVLAISILSDWIQTAVSYLPAFAAGLAVIVLGFVVADFIGDAIMRTRAATQTSYTQWFATGTRMFLYFTAIVIGLDTMGIDVGVLLVFANALAWGIAAAFAIGVGIALGWGGHTYVDENIDRWMGNAAATAPEPKRAAVTGSVDTDGGSDSDADVHKDGSVDTDSDKDQA